MGSLHARFGALPLDEGETHNAYGDCTPCRLKFWAEEAANIDTDLNKRLIYIYIYIEREREWLIVI
jgi:hypothetical protein